MVIALYFLVVLSLSTFCACTHGLTLTKRSTDDVTSSENHLADALRVIEREKRRALYDDLGRQRWHDDANYYNNWERLEDPRYSIYEKPDMEDMGDLFRMDKLGADDNGNVYEAPELWQMESDFPDMTHESAKEGEDSNAVSDDELEDIFDGTETYQEKRNKGGNPLMTEALLGPAGKRSHEKREYDSPEKNMAEEQVEKDLSSEHDDVLFKTADEKADKEIVKNPSVFDTSDVNVDDEVGVADDEINDIFSDDSDDVPLESRLADTGKDEEGDEALNMAASIGEGINREWLMSQYLDNMDEGDSIITRKKKRSDEAALFEPVVDGMSWLEDGNSLPDIAMELARAREDIKVLRTFLKQEDAENAHLAHALNLATKSQTERTDKYVSEEVEYIKKAIQDEVRIEDGKDALHIASSLDQSVVDMAAPMQDESLLGDAQHLHTLTINDIQDMSNVMNEDKRGDSDVLMPDEVGVANDGGDVIADSDNTDISDDDLIKALLAGKLRKLMDQRSMDLDISADQLGGWHDQPVVSSVGDDNDQGDWYLNPLMRELWQKYKTTGSNSLKRGFPPQGDPKPAECPAVEELSNYCNFMTELNLELDEEALELCNRHDMCYTCGSVLELRPDDCDRGYLAEAARLCQDKEDCDKDASRLFILMLRYHSYQQAHAPEQCSYECTLNYIGGPLLANSVIN